MKTKFGMLCLAVLSLSAISACSPAAETAPKPEPEKQAPAEKPSLKVDAKPISPDEVEFEVTTNVPTPIQVMASVNLANQKPDDVWIGYSDKVTLTGPVTTFVLDTSKARQPLPNSSYEADVAFYPRWGAEGNEAAKGFPELSDTKVIELQGTGSTRSAAVRREELQKWVMLNVDMNTPWNEGEYVAKLGKHKKSKADLSHLHDAYYFPDADMTLIVNRLKGEVTIWRQGRQTR
ncbi:MAG: hypothetical protein Q7J28_08425 [Caulobacter sp.]|nr:hypothetical protein [Caulobacter sp.]